MIMGLMLNLRCPHAAMRYVGITLYEAGGPRLRMRTSEPRDRAWWTLAASVPEADIDYSTWSSCRGNPHAYRCYGRLSSADSPR
jgi:hypothetical protein